MVNGEETAVGGPFFVRSFERYVSQALNGRTATPGISARKKVPSGGGQAREEKNALTELGNPSG